MKATQAQLNELHGLLALYLLDSLRDAQPGSLKASLVNVARAFLADNGISADSIKGSRDGAEALSALIANLPDFGRLEDHKPN